MRFGRRKPCWRAPEVVQVSAIDCGPAALKCLLEGFRITVSYGRLREACQTGVDGTSIDALEDVARQLGLDAEQVIVPLDHLLLPSTAPLPAIVVVLLPNGFAHFVVAWRRWRGRVEIMDPATGRGFERHDAFLRRVYEHELRLPAAVWRSHAASPSYLAGLRQRSEQLGVLVEAEACLRDALADPSWHSLARLDATVRMVAALVDAEGVSPGGEAASLLVAMLRELEHSATPLDLVPARYWFARPSGEAPAGPGSEESVLVRGAVLVRAHGVLGATEEPAHAQASLPIELARALEEPAPRPLRALATVGRESGAAAAVAVGAMVVVAAAAVLLEAVLFRAMFDVGRYLNITERRLLALLALLAFLALRAGLEGPLHLASARIGRHLEARFRLAFLRKLPRLHDRYFQSRPVSDMAERSHAVHSLRELPLVVLDLARAAALLFSTAAGLVWLDGASAPLVAVAVGLSTAVPLAAQRSLAERDLRARSHAGALARVFLDALLGSVAVRAHSAARAVEREHEGLLLEWIRATLAHDRVARLADVVQTTVCFALSGWLFFAYFARAGQPAAALLYLYWALTLPAYGRSFARLVHTLPAYRNLTLRLTEPLGALEHEPHANAESAPDASALTPATKGLAVRFERVAAQAGGHLILDDLTLTIPAGSHVAIVGPSGAGKSTLVGLLLGWHRPTAGAIFVEGARLDEVPLDALRAVTAWVDPSIQIWNRSLLGNLTYGAAATGAPDVGEVVRDAELERVVEMLPEGLGSVLGEGGGLVSGGEAQRVRFGRASLRRAARLVVLDEPFRGLDRERRRIFTERARLLWREATLLCVMHDVRETLGFDRVVVVDGGRVVEDGAPSDLLARPTSRYAQLLAAEDAVRVGLWRGPEWRRLRLDRGRLVETPSTTAGP